jgi:glycerol kinase
MLLLSLVPQPNLLTIVHCLTIRYLMSYILALDLGTTGNRAILFDDRAQTVAQSYRELTQYYPEAGWLEHDAEEIWCNTLDCMCDAVAKAGISAREIGAIGLTVQRETCLLWDKKTGKPLHKAIVWQDRRTAPQCRQLIDRGKTEEIQQRTGLVIDAYFSATKLAWLLAWARSNIADFNPDNILAGTIDCWILWKLTGEKLHATDASNASRTMLMNLADVEWDEYLLELFEIPRQILPEIKPSVGIFGSTDRQLLGAEIPIGAIFGDRQAALFASGCDRMGTLTCTYGTGCFLVAQTESHIHYSRHQLLSTLAWKTSERVNYALEGSIFTSGACIQWLRDGLKLVDSAAATGVLATSVGDTNGLYFVPALSGLSAPHWDMNARGAFFGITAGVTDAHMVRAVLESIAYRVREVIEAIEADMGQKIDLLKVDGGVCNNDFLMQFQADLLGIAIERPSMLDVTAKGAAFGAGLAVGLWRDYRELIDTNEIDRLFEPNIRDDRLQNNFAIWQKAVARAKNWVG